MLRYMNTVFIIFSVITTKSDAFSTLTTFQLDETFNEKVDDTNILVILNRSSIMRCAAYCEDHPDCVAFFINTRTRTCQGQSAPSNANMTGLRFSPGFRYYRYNSTIKASTTSTLPPSSTLTTTMSTTCTPGPFICPTQNLCVGSGQLPDGCYEFKIFNNLSVDYTTAFNTCLNYGMNLPKIYEVDKMNFYLENIFTCPDVFGLRFWVDGTNLNASNKSAPDAWTTHDGIVIPQISALWSTARPNYPDLQNCIQSDFVNHGHYFDDFECEAALHQVLCEKKV